LFLHIIMTKKTKIIHGFLTAVLLMATSGFTLHKHYSGNTLYDIGLLNEAETCCTTGGDDARCDCCHDVKEFHKLDVDVVVPADIELQVQQIDLLDIQVQQIDLLDITLPQNSRLFTSEVESFVNLIALKLPPPRVVPDISTDLQIFIL